MCCYRSICWCEPRNRFNSAWRWATVSFATSSSGARLCMKPITLEWVAKAEGDWDTAQREYRARRRPNYDAACFHAQQCAEKYLKARLEEAVIAFGRTHNLVSLLTLVLAVLRAEGFDYTHR